MGWTQLRREPGMTDREFFAREFFTPLNGASPRGEIIGCATVRGAFYAAVRNTGAHPEGPGRVWALVVLIRRGRGQWNFTFKEMDETAGPNAADCPLRILDLLSPTEDRYALDWRRACRERAARKAAASAVKPGTVIRLSRKIKFANGWEGDTFEFVSRSTFRARGGAAFLCRIPGWRAMSFETVTGA